MSLINGLSIGNAFSSAGTALSNFAGAAGLEQQRADLDQQKLQLADQLQGARESAGRVQAGQIAATAATQKAATDKDLINAQGDVNVKTHGAELTQDTQAAADKLKALSTPDALAASKAIALASTIPNSTLQFKDDGTAVMIDPVNKTATLLTDKDGQPVKVTDPAVTQAAIAGFNTIKTEITSLDSRYRTDINAATQAIKAANSDLSLIGPAKQNAVKDAQGALDRLRESYGAERADLVTQLASPRSVLDRLTKGVTPANGATEDQNKILLAPTNPSDRKVDKSYLLPNGKTGIWKGQGWDVQGAAAVPSLAPDNTTVAPASVAASSPPTAAPGLLNTQQKVSSSWVARREAAINDARNSVSPVTTERTPNANRIATLEKMKTAEEQAIRKFMDDNPLPGSGSPMSAYRMP